MNSSLLINEPPLMVLPSLAKKIGLNEAIILQQIHYWLSTSKNHMEGYVWVYNSYSDWQEQFPFWSQDTIKRAIRSLEKKGVLISKNFNKLRMDKTKWYRIDYIELSHLSDSGENGLSMHGGNLHPSSGQSAPMEEGNLHRPIPETNQRLTTDILEDFSNPKDVLDNPSSKRDNPTILPDSVRGFSVLTTPLASNTTAPSTNICSPPNKSRKPKVPKEKKPKELWQTPQYLLEIPEEDLDKLSEEYGIVKERIREIGKGFHIYMRQEGFLYTKSDYRAVLEGRLLKEKQQAKTLARESTAPVLKFDNISMEDN